MRDAASPMPLRRFQDQFASALAGEPANADAMVANLVAQPGFAVYRNTVTKGCLDALQANFPAVARLVGEDWFRAAAAVFVARELPSHPSLLAYGASFPAFLESFGPASALPYLPGVARLDRLWTEAHIAADAPALGRQALAELDPEALADSVLHLHPAARWAWFGHAPIRTIWQCNREDGGEAGEIAWVGEGALLTRPGDAVRWTGIDAAGCRFLDACARGLPMAEAIDAALDADPEVNLVRLVATLFEAGAVARLALPTPDSLRRTTP